MEYLDVEVLNGKPQRNKIIKKNILPIAEDT